MRDDSKQALLSVVVPVYNEQDVVVELHGQLRGAMAGLDRPWEVVYVNDGSRDRTLEFLLAEAVADRHIVIVELSRNWGHQAALTAGLSVARGEAIVLMDGDLQDPPALIPEMVARWEAGVQVVIAERRRRRDGRMKQALCWLFYRALGLLSDYPIPLNAGICGLLDRQPADELVRLAEANRYLPGLRSWIGYTTDVVFYERAERSAGESKQGFRSLVRYACDAIFGFSYKPLRLSFCLGAAAMCCALLIGVAAVCGRLAGVEAIDLGTSASVASTFFLAGVQLFCIGVLGEYIGRIYDEVRRRPLYLVRRIHANGRDGPGCPRSGHFGLGPCDDSDLAPTATGERSRPQSQGDALG